MERIPVRTNRGLRYVCDLFGKLDSPYIANYTLKITTIDHEAKYNHEIIDAVHKSVYIKDYLGTYRNMI